MTQTEVIAAIDVWLKLRTASEQRTYWMVLAIATAAFAILTQREAILCGGSWAKWGLAVVAVATGGIAIAMGFGMWGDQQRITHIADSLMDLTGDKQSFDRRQFHAAKEFAFICMLALPFVLWVGYLAYAVPRNPLGEKTCKARLRSEGARPATPPGHS